MSTYVKFINLFPEIKGYIQEVQREFLTYFVWKKLLLQHTILFWLHEITFRNSSKIAEIKKFV